MLTANTEMLKKIDPLHYFEQFILEGVYPDGRDVMQFRPISVEQSVDPRAYGSSYVQQGGACVSCTVNLSVAPDSDEPPIVYEFKALECVQKEIVEEANLHLSRVINQGYLLDANLLRIDKIQNMFDLRFTLHLEIVAISADGFLTDAVFTAVQAAILSTRLPRVEYVGGTILEHQSADFDDIPLQFDITKLRVVRPSANDGDHGRSEGGGGGGDEGTKRLALKDLLVHTSFLLYSKAKSTKNNCECQLLCDPSAELCTLISGRCDVTMGGGEALYATNFSAAGVAVSDATLAEAVRSARRRHATISAAMERCERQQRKGGK